MTSPTGTAQCLQLLVGVLVLLTPALAATPAATVTAGGPKSTALPNAWEISALEMYAATKNLVVMAVNLGLSLGILFVAGRTAIRARTSFHIGVIAGVIWLLFTDASYFGVIMAYKNPNVFEIVRTISPLLTSGLISGLSLERFRVFGSTTYAYWYTDRKRHVLLFLNYALLIAAVGVLVSTFIGIEFHSEISTVPLRKLTIVLSLTLSVIVDMVLTVLVFRIVLKIRAALDATSAPAGADSSYATAPRSGAAGGTQQQRKRRGEVTPELRATVLRVLMALVAMVIFSVAGILTYGMSSSVTGDMTGAAFARMYVAAAMIQWYLVVDIVRGGRSTGSGSGSGGISVPAAGGSQYRSAATDGRAVPIKPLTSSIPPASPPAISPYSPHYAPQSQASGPWSEPPIVPAPPMSPLRALTATRQVSGPGSPGGGSNSNYYDIERQHQHQQRQQLQQMQQQKQHGAWGLPAASPYVELVTPERASSRPGSPGFGASPASSSPPSASPSPQGPKIVRRYY
ncbi:hypothetical protein BC828DRAFT_407329 [Blastocladiella britannica]|nr:hypothetical protein BC828DRAFT_407329 [Blastocladiella britannica]